VQYTGEPKPGSYRLRVVMKEGRNREVRRLMDAVGHTVVRLFRRRFGPVELGRLRPGEWRSLTADEVQRLRGAGGPRRTA
jgi:23S rRNA pseudouridine2605 synthase